MERRVVITGMGVVSSVGNSVSEFWDSIVNGKSGIDLVTYFDTTEFKTKIAGQVKNFNIEKYMSIKDARRLDPFCQYAVAAADEAMESAGLSKDLSTVNPERVGVNVSSGIGGIKTLEEQVLALKEKGPKRVSPFLIPMMIIDLGAGNISIRYGAKGPNFSAVSACASSTHAIGEAFWMIKRDDADIMITGGAEAGITPISFAGFCSMQAMSTRNDSPKTASRPFDKDRDGFVMSEGSGVLILEELEHAKKRGAKILAEVIGYGASGDANHITAPAPGGTGCIQAVKSAINKAKVPLADIHYINAHGTSTPLNDKLETEAYKVVFGSLAPSINISSTKGSTGHGLGTSGALETIACVKAIVEKTVPPTINYTTPDEGLDLNYTPNTAVKRDITAALNVNLGFGGHNAALIIKKFE